MFSDIRYYYFLHCLFCHEWQHNTIVINNNEQFYHRSASALNSFSRISIHIISIIYRFHVLKMGKAEGERKNSFIFPHVAVVIVIFILYCCTMAELVFFSACQMQTF